MGKLHNGIATMTQEEFKKLWTREAGNQYGLMLDVISLPEIPLNDNKAA